MEGAGNGGNLGHGVGGGGGGVEAKQASQYEHLVQSRMLFAWKVCT